MLAMPWRAEAYAFSAHLCCGQSPSELAIAKVAAFLHDGALKRFGPIAPMLRA